MVGVGGGGLGVGPLGRPDALTLALSRRVGEGTVVVGDGTSARRGDGGQTDFGRRRPCDVTHAG